MMEPLAYFRQAVVDLDNGATEIERQLLRKLLENRQSWTRRNLLEGARLIQQCSVMANLRNLAACIERAEDLMRIERTVSDRLQTLEHLPQLLADSACDLLRSKKLIITISRSSAVEAVLVGVFNQGWRGRVVVLDGTASGCGRTQANRLTELGFEVRSLPDGAMLECLGQPTGELLVLIGADAVGPRRIINAQGSRLLLETALHHGIERVAVADSGKDVEEHVIDGLIRASRVHSEQGPGRCWPVFEIFSRDLVGQRVSEVAARVKTEADPPRPETS